MQATCKGSDQTARMRRLIWGFAGRTYHIVGNLMSQLIVDTSYKVQWYRICLIHKKPPWAFNRHQIKPHNKQHPSWSSKYCRYFLQSIVIQNMPNTQKATMGIQQTSNQASYYTTSEIKQLSSIFQPWSSTQRTWITSILMTQPSISKTWTKRIKLVYLDSYVVITVDYSGYWDNVVPMRAGHCK